MTIRLGAATRAALPPLGLGMPADEIGPALTQLPRLRAAAPRFLQGQFDPRAGHGLALLSDYRALCEQVGAQCVLEIVVTSVEDYPDELRRLARVVTQSGLQLSAIALCPVGDLKSVLPGGPRPPAPPLDALYAAGREAFPGIRLGGGMFSFFTELNRKRPPAERLDFVMNTTCPIVHAADDRSAMETLAALPYQVKNRSLVHRRDTVPGGPELDRLPRQSARCHVHTESGQRARLPGPDGSTPARLLRRRLGAGYVATLARTGVEAISLAAPTGPLGIVYRQTDYAQPWYDSLSGPAVYPVYHVVSGLAHAAGRLLVSAESSDPERVVALAYRGEHGTMLWLANLSAREQTVSLSGTRNTVSGTTLDEDSFARATTDPEAFQAGYAPIEDPARLMLKAYAVATLRVDGGEPAGARS